MKEFLDYTIIHAGSYDLKMKSVIFFVLFITIMFLVLKVAKWIIGKAKRLDVARKYATYSLFKYALMVFSIIFGLQILDFNLSVLIAGSAALLVGIGLGLQNLFSDFISGFILLVDSSIKVDDIIEVNGLVCQVQEIRLRTTKVLTRDDKYIILPNSDLTKNQVINWTHSEVTSRFEVTVGVEYGSDVGRVTEILVEAAKTQQDVLTDPAPFARFTEFGESSLNFSIIFWSEHVFRVENIKSEIRKSIYASFGRNGINIPFPQRVIHMNKQDLSGKTPAATEEP